MVQIEYNMIGSLVKNTFNTGLGTSRPSTKGSVSIPHHDFPITDSEDQRSCGRQPPLVIISLVNVTSSYCIFLFIATRQRSSLDYTYIKCQLIYPYKSAQKMYFKNGAQTPSFTTNKKLIKGSHKTLPKAQTTRGLSSFHKITIHSSQILKILQFQNLD